MEAMEEQIRQHHLRHDQESEASPYGIELANTCIEEYHLAHSASGALNFV